MIRIRGIFFDIYQEAIERLNDFNLDDFAKRYQLEEEVGKILGLKTFVGTNSASSAFASILIYLKRHVFKKKFKILIPAYSQSSWFNPIKMVGGVDFDFVDVADDFPVIDVKSLESYKGDYDAVLYQGLFGRTVERDLVDYVKSKGKILIEDAAQNLLSPNANGDLGGTLGDFAFYSFSTHKTISTGEGGAIAIKDEDLTKEFRDITFYGGWYFNNRERFTEDSYGNVCMSPVLVMILKTALERKDEIVKLYQQEYEHFKGLYKNDLLNKEYNISPYYVIKVDNKMKRDIFLKKLKGIKYRQYKDMGKILFGTPYKNSSKWEEQILILPQNF